MNSRTQIVLFACDELAFTVLDLVEQQLRLHKIDAALDTMGRIADATVRSSAMEAIAISQFKAGDQRGALHTANLIPHEINRNGALMHIAFAQARLGHIKGAIETINRIKAPSRRDAVLLGVVLIRAEGHDVPGALAAANTMGSKEPRPSRRGFCKPRGKVPPLRYGLPFLPALPSGASWQIFVNQLG